MAKRRAIPTAVRDRLLVEAMHRCCLCPEHHDVTDLHHIVPISAGGPNTLDNLMVVCPTCHAKIHRIRNRYTIEQLRMYKERWVRLCALGLPLDVRLARAFDYTRPPEPVGEVTAVEVPDPPPPIGLDSPDGGEREDSYLSNPFDDHGRVNDPARFFDRRRILRELRQCLVAGNSVSLVGELEIGKSSLLYRLYQTGKAWLPGATVLFLDLQGIADEEDFCVEVLDRLGMGRMGRIGSASGTCAPGSRQVVRDLRRVLQRSRIVLLLDEVERLCDVAFFPRLHDLLRALAQEPAVTLAVASHRPLVEVFPPSSATSPFHNVFTEKRLGPFTRKDARDFLAHRLRGTEIAFMPAQAERLVQESGGHPARLQRLAYDLFERKRR